jgi:hypothetical protein
MAKIFNYGNIALHLIKRTSVVLAANVGIRAVSMKYSVLPQNRRTKIALAG